MMTNEQLEQIVESMTRAQAQLCLIMVIRGHGLEESILHAKYAEVG